MAVNRAHTCAHYLAMQPSVADEQRLWSLAVAGDSVACGNEVYTLRLSL